MKKPHVIVVSYPAQGHVIPILEFSQRLVEHGLRVKFLCTEFIHKKIASTTAAAAQEDLTMVSIPDGLEPSDDRKDLRRNTEALFSVPPGELEKLIQRMKGEGDEIACVVADGTMGWALEVAEKVGIRTAAFWTAPAAVLALSFSIPELIRDGIVDGDGNILKKQMVQLSPAMRPMNSTDFIWACVGDGPTRKLFFHTFIRCNSSIKSAGHIICNSAHNLELGPFSLYPDVLSVGPLLSTDRPGKWCGYFVPEDSACLTWLDRRPVNSVIYVAYGTSTVLDSTQLEELALGLELTNRPFLWVVRRDITAHTDEKPYPEGFEERVRDRGLMVNWTPQQQVLSHPSVACFVSHCGWNSTVEGVANGVPFVCWPYYADQLLNQDYICNEWRVGVGLRKDESGIIRRDEIKDKMELLLTDKGYKERALDLRAKTMESLRDGSSHKNLNKFVDWIKDNSKN